MRLTDFPLVFSDTVRKKLRELQAEHGDDLKSVVIGLEVWLFEIEQRADERAAEPVMGRLHKITAGDGRVLRSWWPHVEPATLKSWVRRRHPDVGSDYTVEYRWDIVEEGDQTWLRGKSYDAEKDGY